MTTPIDPTLYVTRLEELLWAGVLVAATMGIHALGMIGALQFDNAFKNWTGRRRSIFTGLAGLILVSWLLVTVHLVEVMIWAGFFQWKDCFPNFSTSNYFALNEYTTVGSSLRLPQNWRLLEGMISTAGLLAFAWSTGVLLTVAREFQAQQLQRIEERRQPHETPGAPNPSAGDGTRGN
jgi:uncharacterized membrane protein